MRLFWWVFFRRLVKKVMSVVNLGGTGTNLVNEELGNKLLSASNYLGVSCIDLAMRDNLDEVGHE